MPRKEKLEIVPKHLGSCPWNYFMSLNLKKGKNFSKELVSHKNTFPIVFNLRWFTTCKFSGKKSMLFKKKEKDGNQQFTEKINKGKQAYFIYLLISFLFF